MNWFINVHFILFSARLSIQGSEGQDESSSEDLQKNLDRTRKLEKDLINASKNQSVEEMKVLKNQQFWSKAEKKAGKLMKKVVCQFYWPQLQSCPNIPVLLTRATVVCPRKWYEMSYTMEVTFKEKKNL